MLASQSGHSRGDAERVFAYTLIKRSFPTFRGGSDHGPSEEHSHVLLPTTQSGTN